MNRKYMIIAIIILIISGVVIYSQYREMENLYLINDELNDIITSNEYHVENIEKYQKKVDEKKNELNQLKSQANDLRSQVNRHTNELEDLISEKAKKEKEIIELENHLESLEQEIMILDEYFLGYQMTINEDNYFENIPEELDIYHFNIDTLNSGEYLSVPAYGPLFTINSRALSIMSENELSAFRILRDTKDGFTKISVDGYIPTWYLSPKEESYVRDTDDRIRYIIEDSDLLLIPSNDSYKLQKLRKGAAIRVIGEYGDWLYVEKLMQTVAESMNLGWIRRNQIGLYEDFDSNIGLEVKVKQEYLPDWLSEEHSWCRIMDETDEKYTLGTTGAGVIELPKENVEGFIMKEE